MKLPADGADLDCQSTAQLLASGGDDRLALDDRGLNVYGCRPTPATVTAYSSSTASSISAAAFNMARALHVILSERVRAGEPAPALYGDGLERLRRRRLLTIYGLHGGDPIDVAFAPSGTDLELLVLALARAADEPVVNILVGEDEVGSGCVHSAAGRHFRTETALVDDLPKGGAIAGFDPAAIHLATIEVRHPNGQARPRAAILDDICGQIDAARQAGRRAIVHIVHRSKTGIVVPGMGEVEQLARRYGRSIDIAVDACQGRISPDNVRRYLAMEATVMVTGSKFIGGPPFSGFAFIPGSLSRRLSSAAAPFPSGLSDYFTRAELPPRWTAADGALSRRANVGLLLRLEAAVFELERLSALPAMTILAVVRAFETAIRAFVATSERFGLFIAAEGLRPESHIDHPFERDMLFTLSLIAEPPILIEEAKALYAALYDDRSGRFTLASEAVVAAEAIHTGQPVKSLQDAHGRIVGTLRLSLSAPLICDLAGLDEDALLARFGADFRRLERKVNLLLRDRNAPSG